MTAIISPTAVNATRDERRERFRANARREIIEAAIDRFQSAIIESELGVRPNAGAACRIGRARKTLIAAIEARDRAVWNEP